MEQMYLYVALVGVGLILFALTRSRSRTDLAVAPAVPPQPAAPSSVDQELKEALEAFMNELEQDNNRLLDSFGALQAEYKQTIADQQAVIRQLESRLAAAEQQIADADHRLTDMFALVQTLEAGARSESPESPLELHIDEEEADTLAAEPSLPSFAFNEKYARVVELHRAGQNSEQIARETGIGLGEIQLVIDLAKREEN